MGRLGVESGGDSPPRDPMPPDATADAEPVEESRRRWSPRRLWPFGLLVLGVVLFFALGLDEKVSWAAFQERRQDLRAYVEAHFATALVGFVLAYVVVTAFSIPISVWMTLAGGVLFGAAAAIPAVVFGATTGATLVFLATRTSLGPLLRERAGPWFARLEQGFRRDQWSYMFFLRLMPVFPFFAVNLAAGFLGVTPTCFVVATALGIVPGASVYALAGAGIGTALEAESFTPESIVSPQLAAALAGLAVLALMPPVYRAVQRRRKAKDQEPA